MPNFIIEPWNGIACGNLFLEKSSHMTRDVGYFWQVCSKFSF